MFIKISEEIKLIMTSTDLETTFIAHYVNFPDLFEIQCNTRFVDFSFPKNPSMYPICGFFVP